MQVILLEHLEGVGAKGATVNVRPGFARNYLLPRRLAIEVGARAAERYQELERQKDHQAHKRIAEARTEAARIDGLEVNITAPNGQHYPNEKINADVAEALAKAGHVVDKRKIEMEEHIKQLGRYEVPIRFMADVVATMKVWVVRS